MGNLCLIHFIHCCIWISIIIRMYILVLYLLSSYLYPTDDLFCLREPQRDRSGVFFENDINPKFTHLIIPDLCQEFS